MKSLKTISVFIAGAAIASSIAVAAPIALTSLTVCSDNRTKVLTMATNNTCKSGTTAYSFSTGGSSGSSFDAKSIASLVTPSVVSIKVTTTAGGGTGSGSIYRTSATSSFIVTNNHVVASAALSGTIMVELTNGELYKAKIVGRDSNYDIAVLSIQKGNLTTIGIGDSSRVSVGDSVLAIGSPLGLASTVTFGIISALNRPVTTGNTDSQSYVNAIQTDAAINPGNSGGALVDYLGRLIGINSAIATDPSGNSSGSIGLGFSIPINEAKRVIEEIITTGKSTRPILGVFFDTTYTGIGAKILRLSPGEGAEKAGIPAGSVIKSIDGVRVVDDVGAIVKIRSYAPGKTVSITVDLPTGESKTFSVTLGSAPSSTS
jgi:putative serine protease PepD